MNKGISKLVDYQYITHLVARSYPRRVSALTVRSSRSNLSLSLSRFRSLSRVRSFERRLYGAKSTFVRLHRRLDAIHPPIDVIAQSANRANHDVDVETRA